MRSHILLIMLILSIGVLGINAVAQMNSPIQNFYQVTGSIYRGARPKVEDSTGNMKWLKLLGIKTIIDLQGGDLTGNPNFPTFISWLEPGENPANLSLERRQALNLGINFLNFPINSLGDVTSAENNKIDMILDLMNTPAAYPIYIHCEHGADRTGLLVALYRVKYQNWPENAAYQEMLEHGHDMIHQAFTMGMDDFFHKKAKQIIYEKYRGKK